MKQFSKPLKWVLSLLVVIVVASFAASLVQNSFFSVKVDKVSFETERGELSGYLFVPRDVDADNPAPAVVLTHGYLNNAEMQEIGAIELSRRGYVVLAFDMYDHGDSRWETPSAFNFYVYAMYDAASYIYEKDYVLKDDDGNGMIGVSGHSMGGFSSTYAVVFDEGAASALGYRKIAAALPVGSDYRYVFMADPWDIYGTRSAGHIAAHYDQFFFDNSADPVGSVIYKDFVNDEVGLKFLGRDDEGTAEAGTWYNKDGGQRIIYTPDETHPQNTWSLETGRNTIEFFEDAFEYQLDLHGLDDLEDYGIKTGSTAQVWWLKEAFTLIALVALIAMIFPLFMVVSKLPVFNRMHKVETGEDIASVEPKENKVLKVFLIVFVALLAAYYLPYFMDRAAELTTLANAMYYIIGGAAFFTILMWVGALLNEENEKALQRAKSVTVGAFILSIIALIYRWLLTNTDIITEVTYWAAPSINTIVYWAMVSGGLILMVTLATTPIFAYGKKLENPYGLKVTWIQLLTSLLTALAMAFGLFLFIAIIEWVFLTDFRFYTYAIKIFNSQQFVAALRYIPLFFIYYFAAGMSIYVNTRKMKNWQGDLLAAFLLAGPVILFLIYQYFLLYNTGVAPFPAFSLSAILSVGLVPTLIFAAIIMRRFSIRNNHIWTGVFFTTVFFTFITLANTAVYLLSVG